MNQKLRTARSGIVILFAILCIVCLSVSLAISAHFAAYADEVTPSESNSELPAKDSNGNYLWLVHYKSNGEDKTDHLWDGIIDDTPITYYYGDGEAVSGKETDKDCFAPFRDTQLVLKLNPDYEIDGVKLSVKYDMSGNVNDGPANSGNERHTITKTTTITLKEKGNADVTRTFTKEWKVVPLCNLVNVPSGSYIHSSRTYGQDSDYKLVKPTNGNIIVYQITPSNGEAMEPIAVDYTDGIKYKQISGNPDKGYDRTTLTDWTAEEVDEANKESDLINYRIRRLEALYNDADNAVKGHYTLTISTVNEKDDATGIVYVAHKKSYDFEVRPLELDEANFSTRFAYDIENKRIDYAEDDHWIPAINLKALGLTLKQGVDYMVSCPEYKIGNVDLLITGIRNITGKYTIKNAVHIVPAQNHWKVLPNIIAWMYGTYDINNNLIVGSPELCSNISDIKFRIVAVTIENNNEVLTDIEGLTDIHYCVDSEGKNTGLVENSVAEKLKNLPAGNYRLFASVYGVEDGQTVDNASKLRNYQPIPETAIDFKVFQGINHWKAGDEPSILGWTAGKLESTEDLFNATAEHGTAILMIYKQGKTEKDDVLIYSNKPEHADSSFGNIEVLKSLKAGRYYLSAEVKGTADYSGLKSRVSFDVVPNNLPIWAVILIVAGSLGIVAVIFTILHQKGVLQMLTGKVIISMRTRANVDATLAAIRAAKVARESEASIAAAKARDAEEAAKTEKAEKPENKE